MKRVRILLAIAIVLSAAVFVSALILRKKVLERPERLLARLPDKADLSLQSIHLTENTLDGKLWELTADSARYFKEEKTAWVEKVYLLFFEKERGAVVLSSERGKVFLETKDVEVSGNVLLTTLDGYIFRSDSLRFNAKERRVYADAPVSLEGPGIKLKGIGMELDVRTERVRIGRDVWTEIEVADLPATGKERTPSEAR